MDIMEFHYIFINMKLWFLMKLKIKFKMWKIYPQNVVILKPLVYCGDIWRPILAKKSFYLNFSFHHYKILCFQLNIRNPLISARSENLIVSEVFCDKDSESRRFQLDQGTYPRLSQSSVHSQTLVSPSVLAPQRFGRWEVPLSHQINSLKFRFFFFWFRTNLVKRKICAKICLDML